VSTTDKDFKVKNGLVVEGNTATVNGYDVITSQNYIPTYIQDSAPVSPYSKYLWWDTSGGDLTLWIESGV
jgi:hypothetical protein